MEGDVIDALHLLPVPREEAEEVHCRVLPSAWLIPQKIGTVNRRDSFQRFVGVFDTCLVWYLLVLPSETHAVAGMNSLRALDGDTSYHSCEFFSFSSLIHLMHLFAQMLTETQALKIPDPGEGEVPLQRAL